MNHLDYINQLLYVENKYHLLEDNIDGFSYWIFHREELMEDMLRKKNHYGLEGVQSGISKIRKYKLRFGMIKNALFHNKVSLKNTDMLVFNHERRVWNGETYECIYTDEIIKLFPKSIVMERPYNQEHFRPVNTPNLIYTDKIEISAMLFLYFYKYIIRKKYDKIQRLIRTKIQLACEELAQFMQINYCLEDAVTMMTNGYFLYQRKKKLLAGEVSKYNPKLILEVVGDNVDCMIINELALVKRIPTVELQHGATGKEHIAYNYPEKTTIKQFPQYFLTFSRFWCKEARYPISEKRRKAVGFPYLERKAGEFRGVERDKKKIILFISQEPIGKELSDIAVELDQKIDRKKYKIIYKLHPGEYKDWQKRYPRLAESGIEVIDNPETALYYLFSVSSYQVGAYGSTATFEGLYFGLPTFVYQYKAISFLKALCEQGYATFFDSVENLYHLILDSADFSQTSTNFWKENALENMRQEIEKIMGGTE